MNMEIDSLNFHKALKVRSRVHSLKKKNFEEAHKVYLNYKRKFIQMDKIHKIYFYLIKKIFLRFLKNNNILLMKNFWHNRNNLNYFNKTFKCNFF
jgi:hypothetical protein